MILIQKAADVDLFGPTTFEYFNQYLLCVCSECSNIPTHVQLFQRMFNYSNEELETINTTPKVQRLPQIFNNSVERSIDS